MAQAGVAKIGNKDLVWSVLATFFKMGAGVLLFPVILRMLPAETVGVWTVFTVVTSLSLLLDFGFNSSFSPMRGNPHTYVFIIQYPFLYVNKYELYSTAS